MNQKNKAVKIVGIAQAMENAQKNALNHANALEKEINEKGLDSVFKRLNKKSYVCSECNRKNCNTRGLGDEYGFCEQFISMEDLE